MTQPTTDILDHLSSPTVTLEFDSRTPTLTIDNPTHRNALTAEMRREMFDHLRHLAHRTDIRAIILTGKGTDFSAGMDISEIDAQAVDGVAEDMIQLEEAIAQFPVPVIAAIRGNCIGAAAQLAVACDLRICDTTARFAITPAKLGLVYPARSIERLLAVVGVAAAKQLLLTGATLDAETAKTLGIVTTLVDTDLDAQAAATACTIASRSPISVRAAKEMLEAASIGGRVPEEVQTRWSASRITDSAVGITAFGNRCAPIFPDFKVNTDE
ncbi:enoyl-CoA hydratase/isomerase family protein [Rhodococcus sp. NPDC057135]|uniref:enoyl-CoA hydratase/isomerase family protein n=1 Tax=Rhodococcus sp. NPDC057135 TaxID=3346028 RepID=UPI0036268512